MRMTTLYAALCGAFLLGTAALSQAQTSNAPAGSSVTNPVKNAEVATSKEYRASKHSQYEVSKAKAEADYDVAKQKCDDQKGADKSACKKEAKATKDKAIADAKASERTVASNAKK